MKKSERNIKLTIEDLAQAVADGFQSTATKQDLSVLRAEMQDGFGTVQKQFTQVHATLTRIENHLTHVDDVLIADHEVRIRRLEGAI